MLRQRAGCCLRRAAQRLFSEHAPAAASGSSGSVSLGTLQQQQGQQPLQPAAVATRPGGSSGGAAGGRLPQAVQQLQPSRVHHHQQPSDRGSAAATAAAWPSQMDQAAASAAPRSWAAGLDALSLATSVGPQHMPQLTTRQPAPAPGGASYESRGLPPHLSIVQQPQQPWHNRPPPPSGRPQLQQARSVTAPAWQQGRNHATPHTQQPWRIPRAPLLRPPQPQQPLQQLSQARGFATAWQKGRNQAAANRRGGRAALPEPPRKPRVNSEIDGPHVRLVFPDDTHKVLLALTKRRQRVLRIMTPFPCGCFREFSDMRNCIVGACMPGSCVHQSCMGWGGVASFARGRMLV